MDNSTLRLLSEAARGVGAPGAAAQMPATRWPRDLHRPTVPTGQPGADGGRGGHVPAGALSGLCRAAGMWCSPAALGAAPCLSGI